MTATRINITPGTDTRFAVTWPVGFDFTGYSVTAFEADLQLRDHLSFTIDVRTVNVLIEWDDRYPRGESMCFALQLRPTPSTGDRTTIQFEAFVTK